MDYDAIDRILDVIEPEMFLLAGNHRLLGAHIERYTWDSPSIHIVWNNNDNNMLKKITLSVSDNDHHEVYRWFDKRSYSIHVSAIAWCTDMNLKNKVTHRQDMTISPVHLEDSYSDFQLQCKVGDVLSWAWEWLLTNALAEESE